jgi:hypothetical protein
MSDRLRRYCESLAHVPEPLRLTQPIDLERFGRVRAEPSEARRVVVFGNIQGARGFEAISSVCADLGLEAELLGRHGRTTREPELALADADIVIGIGRCAIEGLASRRAVYVSGPVGTDGWVTAASHPAIEADGFSGRSTPDAFEVERFRADLEQWTPRLASQSRDLAYAHHDAARHCEALVGIWRRLAREPPRPILEAEELARMARVQAQLESRLWAFSGQAARARLESERLTAEVLRLGTELEMLKATRRYRVGNALARPLDFVRRARNSGNGRSGPHV